MHMNPGAPKIESVPAPVEGAAAPGRPEAIAKFEGEIKHLVDVSGLQYYGVEVMPDQDEPGLPPRVLREQLAQMKELLGADFDAAVAAQILRDQGKYHITVIRPGEMKPFSEADQANPEYWKWRQERIHEFMSDPKLHKTIGFDMYGLGERIGNTEAEAGRKAYFAVADHSMPRSSALNSTSTCASRR